MPDDSLAPDQKAEVKKVAIWKDVIVDVAGIIALVLLTLFGGLDVYLAATLIALIAGVSIGQALKKGGGNVPQAGFIMGVAESFIEIGRRSKGM